VRRSRTRNRSLSKQNFGPECQAPTPAEVGGGDIARELARVIYTDASTLQSSMMNICFLK
jgi:hypothetical protein